MILIFYKLLAAMLIFSVGLITALYPLKKRQTPVHTERAELGEALASGIFLGAAFFHMLPDALAGFRSVYGSIAYPIPELIAVGGFLFMLFLERLSLIKSRFSSIQSIPYMLSLILTIHAVVEGAALGIGGTYSEMMMLLIAILAHKGSESFALCVMLLRHQLPFQRIFWIVLAFALMTPIGIMLGAAINVYAVTNHSGELIAAIFNAFAAGTFLYISTLHHVHFHKHAEDAQGMLEFLCLTLGVGVMGVIALWT